MMVAQHFIMHAEFVGHDTGYWVRKDAVSHAASQELGRQHVLPRARCGSKTSNLREGSTSKLFGQGLCILGRVSASQRPC
jgi:hypothetical protein